MRKTLEYRLGLPDLMLKTVFFYFLCGLHAPLFALDITTEKEALTKDNQYRPVEPIYGSAWTITVENDLFTREDGGYTGGLALNLAHGPYEQFSNQNLPNWLYQIVKGSYIANLPNRRRAVAYAFAQYMQTPENTQTKELQVSDVPYVGLLFGQVRLHAADDFYSDRLSFGVGWIGPLSLAEQSQALIHQATQSDKVNGWDNQLDNELVFQLEASRGYRLYATPAKGTAEFDFIVRGTAAVGNLYSAATAALILRIGRELAISHPVATLMPDRQVNTLPFVEQKAWYAFVGADISLVANDIFVDGNTFNDSHSLPLGHERTRLAAGISWNYGSLAFTIAYAESHLYGDLDPFGSFSITKRY